MVLAHPVRSWGTEGRCAAAGQPQDEVPGNDKVYDYIVFRAADVVDLRIDDPSPGKTEPEPAVTASEQSVRIQPVGERTKAFGCKVDL